MKTQDTCLRPSWLLYALALTSTIAARQFQAPGMRRQSFANPQCHLSERERFPCDAHTMTECNHTGCCWDSEQNETSGDTSCYAHEGMLRLMDGIYPHSGRLDIFHDEKWGSVCDDGWSTVTASVACRHLGYGLDDVVPFLDRFTERKGTGQILLDNIECRGSEMSLLECKHAPLGSSDCNHSEDVELMCSTMYDEGSLRLVGGPSPHAGRVEIYHEGRWGTICDDGFDHYAADVVCREMSMHGGWPLVGSYFGPGQGPIWLDDVNCEGNEERIELCSHSPLGYHDCTHEEDAGVMCELDANLFQNEGDLRLVNGDSDGLSGYVEIHHAGSWGKVCDTDWTDVEADVACRQLEYRKGRVMDNATYSNATTHAWLNDVSCVGGETTLDKCRHSSWGGSSDVECQHGMQASVICSYWLEEGQQVIAVRLVGSFGKWLGRVEILVGGEWGTVCDDNWGYPEARVVCRWLGYYDGVPVSGGVYGPGIGQIWMDNVSCTGNETRLEQCKHLGWGKHDCSHLEDAGVMCRRHLD